MEFDKLMMALSLEVLPFIDNSTYRSRRVKRAKQDFQYFAKVYTPHRLGVQLPVICDDPVSIELWNEIVNKIPFESVEAQLEWKYNERLRQDFLKGDK